MHTGVRIAIDALDYEYNHDARTQSSLLSAVGLQLATGGCWLGPRDQEEQGTQRASFAITYHMRVHTAAAAAAAVAAAATAAAAVGHRAGFGCLVE